jgi:PD-(D/E)XK nuclease superfamily
MSTDEHRLNEISERIIGCAYKVSNTLGYGFLEKVYENALEQSHVAQCLNYLKATELRLCLLLNFGRARIEVRRVIL